MIIKGNKIIIKQIQLIYNLYILKNKQRITLILIIIIFGHDYLHRNYHILDLDYALLQ